MNFLGLEETSDRLAEAKEMRWYGHMGKNNDDVLRRALHFEAIGRRGSGRLKMT